MAQISATMPLMRFVLALFLVASAAAQPGPRVQLSHTKESLRGVSAVSRKIAWASGTHGTFLRTIDSGVTWTSAQVPDATTLDFRAVVAFSADEAFLMSAGPGDQSRIYHTSDGGQHWQPIEDEVAGNAGPASLIVLPAAPDTLFALFPRRGVYTTGIGFWTAALPGKSATDEQAAGQSSVNKNTGIAVRPRND